MSVFDCLYSSLIEVIVKNIQLASDFENKIEILFAVVVDIVSFIYVNNVMGFISSDP